MINHRDHDLKVMKDASTDPSGSENERRRGYRGDHVAEPLRIEQLPPLRGSVAYAPHHETNNAAGATEAAAGEHDVVNLVSEDEGPPNSDKPEASAKGRGAAAEPKPNHKPEPRTNHCCSSIIIAPDFCSSI